MCVRTLRDCRAPFSRLPGAGLDFPILLSRLFVMEWQLVLDGLEREAAQIALNRAPIKERAPGKLVTLVSDCAGQGSFPQALSHLGLKVHVLIATELDPAKRELLHAVHAATGCRVDKVLESVPSGCKRLCRPRPEFTCRVHMHFLFAEV